MRTLSEFVDAWRLRTQGVALGWNFANASGVLDSSSMLMPLERAAGEGLKVRDRLIIFVLDLRLDAS